MDNLLLFGIQCAQQMNFWPYVNVEVGKKANLTKSATGESKMDISSLLPAGDPVIPYDIYIDKYSLPSINVNPRECIKVNIYRGVNS